MTKNRSRGMLAGGGGKQTYFYLTDISRHFKSIYFSGPPFAIRLTSLTQRDCSFDCIHMFYAELIKYMNAQRFMFTFNFQILPDQILISKTPTCGFVCLVY